MRHRVAISLGVLLVAALLIWHTQRESPPSHRTIPSGAATSSRGVAGEPSPPDGAPDANPASPVSGSLRSARLLSELQQLLRKEDSEDDRLIALLVSISRLVLQGDAEALAVVRNALQADRVDPRVLPYLLVIRSLHEDANRVSDLQGLVFHGNRVVACFALKSLLICPTQKLKEGVGDDEVLSEFWAGAFLDHDFDNMLRPGYLQRLLDSRRTTEEEAFSEHARLGEAWFHALGTPEERGVRSIFARAVEADIPEDARVFALSMLIPGADEVARTVLSREDSPRLLREQAVCCLGSGRENRAFLLSRLEREQDPLVLSSMSTTLTSLTSLSDQVELREDVSALEVAAGRAGENEGLAAAIAEALSVLDTEESVDSLSRLARHSPSSALKLQCIVQLSEGWATSKFVAQRMDALVGALSEVEPTVSRAAAGSLLHMLDIPAAAPKVKQLIQSGLSARIREALSSTPVPEVREQLLQKLDAAERGE